MARCSQRYCSQRYRYGHTRGQGMVEYALIILLVAIAVVAALALLGPTIANIFNSIPGSL